jgi:hypothetical protein
MGWSLSIQTCTPACNRNVPAEYFPEVQLFLCRLDFAPHFFALMIALVIGLLVKLYEVT